jgi:hypothetical protein
MSLEMVGTSVAKRRGSEINVGKRRGSERRVPLVDIKRTLI